MEDSDYSHNFTDNGRESEDHEDVEEVKRDEIVYENESSDDGILLADLQRK